MDYDKVNDSGVRESFPSGSRRDTRNGKGRFDLIPPRCITRLAKHYENGATKYGDRNWEKGQPSSRYMDSLLRHAFRYLDGERDEDHLAAIAWNAFGIMFNEMYTQEHDDLTQYTQERANGDTSNA